MVLSALEVSHPRVRKLGWQLLYGFLASRFGTSDWLCWRWDAVGAEAAAGSRAPGVCGR